MTDWTAKIPKDLQAERRFCVWVLDGDKKRPFGVTSGRASEWNRDLGTLEAAVAALAKPVHWNGADVLPAGVGMVMGDGVSGVDLDQARLTGDDGKKITRSWARDIVEAARGKGVYVEISQSGNGLHIIGRASDGLTTIKEVMRCAADERVPEGKQQAKVELYAKGQFLALTGRRPKGFEADALGDLTPVWRAGLEAIRLHGVNASAHVAEHPNGPANEDDDEMVADFSRTATKELDRKKQVKGQPGGIALDRTASPLDLLNAVAVMTLDAWFPNAFPAAKPSGGAWKLEPNDLGRSEGGNRLSAKQGEGIKDFWSESRDADDHRKGDRSALDLFLRPEYQEALAGDFAGATSVKQAARNLVEAMGGGLAWALRALNAENTPGVFRDILGEERRPLRSPAFPANILPKWLEAHIRHVARRLRADQNAVCFTYLCAACMFVPRGFRLDVRGDGSFLVNGTIWLALVGAPGAAKSAVLKAALEPLSEAEKRWGQDFARRKAEWDRQQEKKPKGRKAADTENAPRQADDDADEAAPPMLAKPVRKRRRVDDATMEKLIVIMGEQTDGLIQVNDELAKFFGGFDAYRRGNGGPGRDASAYLSIFDGASVAIDRIGRETSHLPDTHMSLAGTIQPGVLGPLAANFSANGMLQRIVYAPMADAAPCRDHEPLDTDSADLWSAAAALLLDLKSACPGGATIVSDKGAVEAWKTLDDWRAAPETLADAAPWEAEMLAKTSGLVGRFALGLHLLWWASEKASDLADDLGAVSDAPALALPAIRMQQAARLIREFVLPAARIVFSDQANGEAQEDARAVALWIRKERMAEFSVRDVVRKCRRFMPQSDAAKRDRLTMALAILEDAGWIVPAEERAAGLPSRWQTTTEAREG